MISSMANSFGFHMSHVLDVVMSFLPFLSLSSCVLISVPTRLQALQLFYLLFYLAKEGVASEGIYALTDELLKTQNKLLLPKAI